MGYKKELEKIVYKTALILREQFNKEGNLINWISWLMDYGYSYDDAWFISNCLPQNEEEEKIVRNILLNR